MIRPKGFVRASGASVKALFRGEPGFRAIAFGGQPILSGAYRI